MEKGHLPGSDFLVRVVNQPLVSLTIWNYAMLHLFIAYLVFHQKMLNWLFGHHRTLTTLLSKKLHQW